MSGQHSSGGRGPGRPAAARETLLQLLEPVVLECGADLEDVQVTPAGKRRLVRVVVDADGGIGLDAVALVSQRVSSVLDESADADRALGGSPYVLEVSSPGVDRPLTEPRHWRRAHGRLVTATLREGGEVTGRVLRADEEQVVLAVGDAGAERALALAEVAKGRVQVEFSRPGADEVPAEGDAGQPDDDETDEE
ncbi:MAG TPA: ribosome maturation factor RimP [Motilibacteraceae bacterium]|nr:ribosome maturation factor RimP [Motilibacteraceae bacterium]